METQVAWAAGLFEGEGSVSMSGQGLRSIRAYLSSTDEDVVRHFQAAVGMGRIFGPKILPGVRKPVWHWRLTSFGEVRQLYAMFQPWLGHRRRSQFETSLARQRGNDPVWRAERSAAISRQMKAQWADPEYAARQRARMAQQARDRARLVKKQAPS